MKKLLLTGVILLTVVMNSIGAYQTAPGAVQVTFKNGLNIYADINEGVNIWK